MHVITGRRRTAVAAAALALGALALPGPGHADTGRLAYLCKLPVIPAETFQIEAGTNAPPTVFLGRSFTPTLTTKAHVPPKMVTLMSDTLKAKFVDGTITSAVRTNGTLTPVVQNVRRTAVPAGGSSTLTLTGTGALAPLVAKAPGSTTYLPGDLKITLRFYSSASDTSAEEFKNLPCTMGKNSAVLDKVAFAKSPSKVTPAATYAKASRKVTATARVTATSGAVPTGKVTAVLYKGTAKLRTVALNLSGGKVATTFTGIKAKGSYKVVFTYGGSATVNGSSGVRTFAVR